MRRPESIDEADPGLIPMGSSAPAKSATRTPTAPYGTLPAALGFKPGASGAHSARTLMLPDLAALLATTPPTALRGEFQRRIVEENILGKRTSSNRSLSFAHLVDLYGLDAGITVFRLLRHFWADDEPGRPVLAMLCAQARDALFRMSSGQVLAMKPGETATSADFMVLFNREAAGRFSEATNRSIGQNVAASWAQAGFLHGKVRKVRALPVVTPAAAAYALALGYLSGLRGQILIESQWARLLDISRSQVIVLAQEASRRSWLDFKAQGNVFEIAFPQLLTQKEVQVSHGPD